MSATNVEMVLFYLLLLLFTLVLFCSMRGKDEVLRDVCTTGSISLATPVLSHSAVEKESLVLFFAELGKKVKKRIRTWISILYTD